MAAIGWIKFMSLDRSTQIQVFSLSLARVDVINSSRGGKNHVMTEGTEQCCPQSDIGRSYYESAGA